MMNRYHVLNLRPAESKGDYGSLKHRRIGEYFVAYVSELKKTANYIINTILALSSHGLTISQVFYSLIHF